MKIKNRTLTQIDAQERRPAAKSHWRLLLAASLCWFVTGQAAAQSLTTLHSFNGLTGSNPPNSNSGGSEPVGAVLAGNTLYGTASSGGSGANGTLFAINIDGTGFKVLHNFTAPSLSYPYGNSDGGQPRANLILNGNTLYGTAYEGGSWGNGTVFSINTDGTGFVTLYSFGALSGSVPSTNADGANPASRLVLSGDTLYGTTGYGGSGGFGTLFALNTNGSGFTVIHNFAGSDGASPSGLILSGGTLYGSTARGGPDWTGGYTGNGTVFSVNSDGSGFTNLYAFSALSADWPYTNSDGADPNARLILFGNTLYGTASAGGTSGGGTVFAVNTDGTGFTNLHSFPADPLYPGPYSNSDGDQPVGGVTLSGNTLYGAAGAGGSSSSGSGTLFALQTDGSSFRVLHNFTAQNNGKNSDGFEPTGPLIFSADILYGTAAFGGSYGGGTVFKLFFPPPQLTITPDGSGGYFIVVHGTANLTYSLQRASSATGPWSTSAPQAADASGMIEFHDWFAPPNRAFYRAVQQ